MALKTKKKNKTKALTEVEREIAEIEARLTPEAKAILEEVREIRRKFGKMPFKVTDLVREMREGDD